MRRNTEAFERFTASHDRLIAAFDRQAEQFDRQAEQFDRQTEQFDRQTRAFDNQRDFLRDLSAELKHNSEVLDRRTEAMLGACADLAAEIRSWSGPDAS